MPIESSFSDQSPSSAATADRERHRFVDALRGIALLGILIVNIEFIVQASEVGWRGYSSGLDNAVRWLIAAFGQTKVYPLFALLFGYGLSLQLSRVDRDATLGPRYRRRMVLIGVLGVAHGVLFFPGDILVIYAVVGAVAYRFRNHDSGRLIRLAATVYALAAAVWLVAGVADALAGASVPTVSAETLRILSTGTFGEVVALHVFEWAVTLAVLALVQGPAVFAFFLLGVALGRTDWLSNPAANRDKARRVLAWAPLAVGGAALGATLAVIGGRWDTLGFAVGFAAAPGLAAGYVAALSYLYGPDRGGRGTAVLESSGRMSLTIYLLESVVASTIAYGYGLGRFGQTGPLAGLVMAVLIWLGLSGFARLWMRFARFGPAEWLLRSWTYRAIQPLRVRR